MATLHQFDIRNFTDKLTPVKGKNRYICPVCQNNNLTIAPESGEYQCWNGCTCADIRGAISPWVGVTGDNAYPTHSKRIAQALPKAPTPAPIPDIRELAKLPAPATHPEKRKRGANTEIEYPYSDTQWVLRTEKPNAEKPKGYEKITLPYHLNETGEEVCGKGAEAWPPYRMDEIKAHGTGKWVLGVEGESCVEAARFFGLVAFTLQGGSWNKDQLAQTMLQVKQAGAAGVAYFPDHDDTGYKKAAAMAEAAAKAQVPFVQINPLELWPNIPEKGDIADWVKCDMYENWNKEKFVRQLEKQFQKAAFSLIKEQKANDPDERLRLELKALGKETDPIRFMRKRAEIASHYRLKSSEIDKAIKYLSEASQTTKPRAIGLDDLFDSPSVTVEYVVPGMLPVSETALLVADPKAGKSLLAYDLAFAVATGESYFLGEPVKQGKVLIVQCDESKNTAIGRLKKRGFRHEDAQNVRFVESFSIDQLGDLETILEDFRPTLVVIDSLRRISAGREISENSSEFADSIYSLKEIIGRYNAAGILIHHSSKNLDAVGVGRVRGSSAIAGAVWGVWQLDQIAKPDPNNKKRMVIDPKDPTRILSIIARDVEGQRLKIELNPENNSWISHGEEFLSEEQAAEHKSNVSQGHLITELLKSVAPTGLEASEINEQLKIGRGIYSVLNRLVGRKIIGTRPSATDRRRTVYYTELSHTDDSLLQQDCDIEKPPYTPPPIPTVSDVIEYSESITEQSIQSSITFDHTSITNRSHHLDDLEEENNSNLHIVIFSESDHLPDTQGGGVGVHDSDSTHVINSQLAQAEPAPKPPKFKVGERVRFTLGGRSVVGTVYSFPTEKTFFVKGFNCTVPLLWEEFGKDWEKLNWYDRE